jgi:hypothetical protein
LQAGDEAAHLANYIIIMVSLIGFSDTKVWPGSGEELMEFKQEFTIFKPGV